MLLRDGRELRLIPRYLDLLIFLVEHRHRAVHRRDIFERVWADVIVSESALAQAIRTLRRTLGDDSREPIFIRTISRHGYQFVYVNVIEEPGDERPMAAAPEITQIANDRSSDPFEPLLQRIAREPDGNAEVESQREAAEQLHALGTHAALEKLGTRPGHAFARALLRDTRWDVLEAGSVPLVGQPGAFEAAVALIALRVRRVARLAAGRCLSASVGGGCAGLIAGLIGGSLLSLAPGSHAPAAIAAVLGLIGMACGAWGGAGVGFGVSMAEATARSRRRVALVAGGAFGGGLAGAIAQWLGGAALLTLVGVHVDIAGTLPGLTLGAAVGLGLALSTRTADAGFAAPRGRGRFVAALVIALITAAAALALALSGIPLVGGTIHAIAQASSGSEAALTPLGQLLGEPNFGPMTRALIGTGEGLVFGVGVALGLTHRPSMGRQNLS